MADDFPVGNAEGEVQDEGADSGQYAPAEGVTLQKAATWGGLGLLGYFFAVAIFGSKGN